MKKLITILLATMLLSGCAATPTDSTQTKRTSSFTDVDVVEFPQYDTVCFVSDGYKSGGIDCISLTPQQ